MVSKAQKATSEIPNKVYEAELFRLQTELVKLQEWVRASGARVVVIFEGRDGAGKGGTIKRITEYLNPRVARIEALPAPTDRERGQWYYQRYIAQLPTKGEIVLFDRSWYNRAGVEKVMGFCTPQEHELFLQQTPIFEQMLIDDGILLRKYWFSVSEDEMMARTDMPYSPWYLVESDIKKHARLNMIAHLLSTIEYRDVKRPKVKLPAHTIKSGNYQRPPRELSTYVDDHVATLMGSRAATMRAEQQPKKKPGK
jgi:polyphosphate kinase 2 (PPK2 family)